jgi:flagellar protein FliS
VEVDEMSPNESDVARAYAKTAASTVTNGPMLLVKLFDRLVQDVELAKEYLTLGDNQRASDAVQHAEKIVVVLRSSLQPDGFEGGRTLLALYNTLTDLLIKANLKRDVAVLDLCQQIIAPLHDGWTRAVAREMGKERAGAQIGVA